MTLKPGDRVTQKGTVQKISVGKPQFTSILWDGDRIQRVYFTEELDGMELCDEPVTDCNALKRENMTKNEIISMLQRCVRKACAFDSTDSNEGFIRYDKLHFALEAEREEEKPWEPKEGQMYYFVCSDGMVDSYKWIGDDADRARLRFFNVFDSREAAQAAADAIKSLLKGRGI